MKTKKCRDCRNYISFPAKYKGCNLKTPRPWIYKVLCKPDGWCMMYKPMAKTKLLRIESAHQPINGGFYLMTRYRDTYYDACDCLKEEDCLNGEIYLDDCLLEEKDRDGIWSLGPDAKFIVACDYEPYWDKDIHSYVTGIHVCDMDEYVRTKRKEYPDKTWTYIPWPEKLISEMPAGGDDETLL